MEPWLAALSVCVLAAPAAAKPQWNAGVGTAVCGVSHARGSLRPRFCGALHADILFLRDRGSDLALGPSLSVGTAGFDDLRLDPGLSLLLPIATDFPLVLEAGPHLRNFNELGVFGSAFWGLRSFNHHGHYEMAAGLFFTAERTLGTEHDTALWLGLRIDGSWLALPFILGYSAIKR